jgi:hypothetical protein
VFIAFLLGQLERAGLQKEGRGAAGGITAGFANFSGARSACRSEARHGHLHQTVDRCLGGQAARGCEGVEAVGGELIGRDVLAQDAGLRTFAHEIADEILEVLLCAMDAFAMIASCTD